MIHWSQEIYKKEAGIPSSTVDEIPASNFILIPLNYALATPLVFLIVSYTIGAALNTEE